MTDERRTEAAPVETPHQGPSADQVMLGDVRRFRVGDRELIVRAFTIGDFRRMAQELGELAQRVVREHPEIDFEHLDQHLPAVFPVAADLLMRVLAHLFQLEQEFLEEHLTLVQASEIVVAALEVNQLPEIVKNARSARQLVKTIAVP